MRKTTTIFICALSLLAIVVLGGCSTGQGTVSGTTTPPPASTTASGTATGGSTVSISGFAFVPTDVTVKAGQSVTWTNNDSTAHTVTGTGFDSGQIAPGATWSHTFDAVGTVDYHCSIHPSMTAKITVQ